MRIESSLRMHKILRQYLDLIQELLTGQQNGCFATETRSIENEAPELQFTISLDAKHANNKAAKKAAHNRPKKSRPSDINRKPTNYPTWESPPEYTISDN
eukprot:scaffold8530_cov154-Skeletonema_dohrnii-CCMP3373.AAC.5